MEVAASEVGMAGEEDWSLNKFWLETYVHKYIDLLVVNMMQATIGNQWREQIGRVVWENLERLKTRHAAAF